MSPLQHTRPPARGPTWLRASPRRSRVLRCAKRPLCDRGSLHYHAIMLASDPSQGLLNRVEKALMNNPVRAFVHRQVEARILRAMGGPAEGARCLEVGCGRGVGVEIILDLFGATQVDAFDLDPDMVRLARRRLERRGARARLWTGSATRIEADDGIYDAAFDFGIVHHIPDWQAAIRELHRVLRPGGRLYAEEILEHYITHPFWRRVLRHPQHDRFDADGFEHALREAGFVLHATRRLRNDVVWVIADKPAA